MENIETARKNGRDDFDSKVISLAKVQAAYICSRPQCRRSTVAPSLTDENKIQYMGKVAHIAAAAPGGPRYDPKMTEEERKSISNAIFLCSSCADMIDKNRGIDYSTETLHQWKEEHRHWVTNNLNKSQQDENAFIINSHMQSGGINAQIVNINGINNKETDASKQHDIKTFQRSETIINNSQWDKLLQDLKGNASCKIRESDRLSDIYDFFLKAENGFIDEEIDSAKETFIKTIPPLTNMILYKFDQWPYHQNVDNFSIQLKPDYLRDTMYKKMNWEERQQWDILYEEMVSYLNEISLAYNSFRKTVKRKLFI
jgi:hypothetical protein